MDATILPLFSTEEILRRLATTEATGALHVFTFKEAANLFFRGGVVVGAGKGLMEGEEVLQKTLEWSGARYSWNAGEEPAPGMRAVEIQIPDFLTQLKLASKLKDGGEPSAEGKEAHPILSIPSRATATGPVSANKTTPMNKPFDDAPPRPAKVARQELLPVNKGLSATIQLDAGPEEEGSFEEALMRKHQLALVPTGEGPEQRLRIIRSSNLVGRNPACDFTLNHSSVSRQHCLLQVMERGLHVKDLSTTNGTKVNGIKLTEGYVSVGDKLTIGHLDFLVEKDEPQVV